MMIKRSLLVFALCTAAVGASAEVYKWIDADGKVQYGDAPPKNVKATIVTGGVTVVPATPVPQAPAAKQEPKGDTSGDAARAVNTPQPMTQADQAAAAREEARQKAIERCKNNRGVDCENEVDAQMHGEPGVGYVQGIPGWSQPPIRPNRPQNPIAPMPPVHKPAPKPHEQVAKEAKMAPPASKHQSQSSSLGMKPMQ
jgi:hypothetical protein